MIVPKTYFKNPSTSLLLGIISIWILGFAFATAPGPRLVLTAGQKQIEFSQVELLKRNDLVPVDISSDPAYQGKKMRYIAVPFSQLLRKLEIRPSETETVEFKARDGFAIHIPAHLLLNKNSHQAVAYLAIEPTQKPWPPMQNGQSPGPFYLVWQNATGSHLTVDDWPYQIASIRFQDSLASLYPKIIPTGTSASVLRGFAVFKNTCFACHTMNLQGPSHLGPDLNVPMNPTEYLKPGALKKLIRNPSSVRKWPNLRMPGFSAAQISNTQLDDLISYLQERATHKH